MFYYEVFMYTRFTTSKKSKHPTLQIVEGKREGKKVKQKIIASFGVVKNDKDKRRLVKFAENFIRKLQENDYPIEENFSPSHLLHKKTVYDGFSLATERLMELTGFSQVVQKAQGKKSFDLTKIVNLIIAQRLDLPSSKLRTYEKQQEHGFQEIELQHLYRTMDVLEPLSSDIQKQAFTTLCAYSDASVECFFFDVTTLYFESTFQDELKNFGFSKDQKHHSVQIVLALVVDSQGIPIAYEVFEGNLAETKTLIPVLKALKDHFSIKTVTVVCDRGLASKQNIQSLQDAEFNFVIATKLKSISKKIKINDLSHYKPLPGQENVPEEKMIVSRTMEHPQYSNTTLIVTYSPKRAEKDKKDRERLLEKLQEKLSHTGSVKKVISNGGYKKYTDVKKGSLITLNQKAIEEDATWDGFHGIAVSNNANLTASDALLRYRDLWRVEEAFRIAKSTLKTRPIFHWKPHRIRGHILLCFMTLYFERFLEMLLRKNNYALTPDKIRHALLGVHTIYFENKNSTKEGKMKSSLPENAVKIFETLNISTQRLVAIN